MTTLMVILTSASCYDFDKFDRFDCFQREDGCAESSTESTIFIARERDMYADQIVVSGEMSAGVNGWMSGGDQVERGGAQGEAEEGIESSDEEQGAVEVDPVESGGGQLTRCDPSQQCEPIDCASFTRFELTPVGATGAICERITYEAQAHRCVNGRCATRDEYCVELSREVEMTSEELGECGAINGCVNDTPPNVSGRAPGRSCGNGVGVCNDAGQCTISSCNARSVEAGYLCFDQARVNGRCSFNVQFGAGLGLIVPVDCDAACEDSGGVCVGSYEDESVCATGGGNPSELLCDRRLDGGRRVCICEYVYD